MPLSTWSPPPPPIPHHVPKLTAEGGLEFNAHPDCMALALAFEVAFPLPWLTTAHGGQWQVAGPRALPSRSHASPSERCMCQCRVGISAALADGRSRWEHGVCHTQHSPMVVGLRG